MSNKDQHRIIMNEREINKTISRIAKSLLSDISGDAALIGIKSRGFPLAQKIAKALESLAGTSYNVGSLDINLYRDDLSEVSHKPQVKPLQLPFSIDGKKIVLVDDVLYTGRTVRAAMDALIDHGRPSLIKFAVLVDRGWRELPIHADYVGKSLKTAQNNRVMVHLQEIDGINEVLVKG